MAYGGIFGQKTIVDAFTKDETMKDATAALFGFGSDSVPNDAFAYLGKYAQHWWRRRRTSQIAIGEAVTLPSANTYSKAKLNLVCFDSPRSGSNSAFNTTPVYSQCTLVDGELVLSGDSSVGNYSYNTYLNGNLDPAKGKYFKSVARKIYKVDANATPQRGRDKEDSDFWVWMSPLYPVFIQENPWECVQSSDRSAYPDSGEQDGYEYEYLGVPFDNAVNSTKIETGSYTGTGTYGQSNPNTLTFGFKPKLLLVSRGGEGFDSSGSFGWLYGLSKTIGDFNDASSSVSLSGRTISWYNTYNAQSQRNLNGVTYYYVAIG